MSPSTSRLPFPDLDLDLLGSLLHPRVRWAQCLDRDEVLDWYRPALTVGTRATVDSVEVDRDAVILSVTVTGQSEGTEGTRPAAAERLYQAFIVDGTQIVAIRGHPDRARALARQSR